MAKSLLGRLIRLHVTFNVKLQRFIKISYRHIKYGKLRIVQTTKIISCNITTISYKQELPTNLSPAI